jgi:hypothetical protein
MTWVKFSDRKPIDGTYMILRSPGYNGGNSFEGGITHLKNTINVSPAYTHWWDGERDSDLAIKEWYETTKIN